MIISREKTIAGVVVIDSDFLQKLSQVARDAIGEEKRRRRLESEQERSRSKYEKEVRRDHPGIDDAEVRDRIDRRIKYMITYLDSEDNIDWDFVLSDGSFARDTTEEDLLTFTNSKLRSITSIILTVKAGDLRASFSMREHGRGNARITYQTKGDDVIAGKLMEKFDELVHEILRPSLYRKIMNPAVVWVMAMAVTLLLARFVIKTFDLQLSPLLASLVGLLVWVPPFVVAYIHSKAVGWLRPGWNCLVGQGKIRYDDRERRRSNFQMFVLGPAIVGLLLTMLGIYLAKVL
ncbi:MAG: hypothetical protein U1E67_03120 [Hyphomicrobiales bacterium]